MSTPQTKPFLTWLQQPGRLTAALGRDMTKTWSADWSPGKSLLRLACDTELNALSAPFISQMMNDYIEINDARADLKWGDQVSMPERFKKHFAADDNLFGGYDENHVPMQTLADIAESSPLVASRKAVSLIEKIATSYAAQENSYLSTGGQAGKKYLGPTGRLRKFAMILTLLHCVKRVYRLPGWEASQLATAWNLYNTLILHLGRFLTDGPLPDEAFPGQHIGDSEYVSAFQAGMARSALLRWANDPEIPVEIRDRCSGFANSLAWWIKKAIICGDDGLPKDCWYDVTYPDPAKTATAVGARSGMNEALNLAGVDAAFDAFLKKVKEKVDPYPIRVKFGIA